MSLHDFDRGYTQPTCSTIGSHASSMKLRRCFLLSLLLWPCPTHVKHSQKSQIPVAA